MDTARSVRRYIADTARDIRTGRLLPGDVLPLRRDADRLGITRRSLREYLRRLQADRLVVPDGPEGLRVAPLDGEELAGAWRLCKLLMPDLAAQASQRWRPDERDRLCRAVGPSIFVIWDSEDGFDTSRDRMFDLLQSVTTRIELHLFRQLTSVIDRSIRIGLAELRRDSPGTLWAFDSVRTGALEAWRRGDLVAVRTTAAEFAEGLDRIAQLSLRLG